MGKLSDYIKDNIVKPEMDNKKVSMVCEIIEYYKNTSTAKIGYTNHFTNGIIEIDNVMVAITTGVKRVEPKKGDNVLVSFVNNSPLIIMIVDPLYYENNREKMKHSRKGSYLPDTLSSR